MEQISRTRQEGDSLFPEEGAISDFQLFHLMGLHLSLILDDNSTYPFFDFLYRAALKNLRRFCGVKAGRRQTKHNYSIN